MNVEVAIIPLSGSDGTEHSINIGARELRGFQGTPYLTTLLLFRRLTRSRGEVMLSKKWVLVSVSAVSLFVLIQILFAYTFDKDDGVGLPTRNR